jgi:hypothetical protein
MGHFGRILPHIGKNTTDTGRIKSVLTDSVPLESLFKALLFHPVPFCLETILNTKKSLPIGKLNGCKINGVPEEIRTPDLQFRKLLLYPAELLGHFLNKRITESL